MGLENLFRFTGLAAFLAGAAISIYYRRRANLQGGRVSSREERPWIYAMRSIGGLFLWLSALVYFIQPAWIAWASLPFPLWLRGVGAAMGVLSVPLIAWVFRSLGHNVTPTIVTRREHTLVTSGPYRYVRHPLYTAGMLSFTGIFLLSANVLILVGLGLTLPFLALRTPYEEARLIERFGDQYRDYMQRTGRYLPRLKKAAG
jgi:protein-S-isoprenylcysteine O-methyltransferase Ste14